MFYTFKSYLKISLLAFVLFTYAGRLYCQTAVSFDTQVKDFGTIKMAKPVQTVFYYQNKGNTPLTIETVKITCGCTTPTFDDQPLPPGKKSFIKVTYTPDKKGAFVKGITVVFEGITKPYYLYIKGKTE